MAAGVMSPAVMCTIGPYAWIKLSVHTAVVVPPITAVVPSESVRNVKALASKVLTPVKNDLQAKGSVKGRSPAHSYELYSYNSQQIVIADANRNRPNILI